MAILGLNVKLTVNQLQPVLELNENNLITFVS